MLRDRFYPITQVDFSDLNFNYTKEPFAIKQSTSIKKVTVILTSCLSSSAPGDDEILFSFLKALGEPVVKALTLLTNTSLMLEHFPPFLKKARTIVFKKPGKAFYETASLWKSIALLKTISKIIEKVIAKRIKNAAEARNFLSPNQMGIKAGRGIDTALELLTSMVKII